MAYRISRPFGIFRVREHSVSPEALSERAKHASLAAGETIGGASARGKNSTGSAFLYASPGTSDSSRYSSLNFYFTAIASISHSTAISVPNPETPPSDPCRLSVMVRSALPKLRIWGKLVRISKSVCKTCVFTVLLPSDLPHPGIHLRLPHSPHPVCIPSDYG